MCAPSAVLQLESQSHPVKSTIQRRGHRETTPTRQSIAAYRSVSRGRSEGLRWLLAPALALLRDVKKTTATAKATARTNKTRLQLVQTARPSWINSYATPPRSLPPRGDHVLLPKPPPSPPPPPPSRNFDLVLVLEEEQVHRKSISNKKKKKKKKPSIGHTRLLPHAEGGRGKKPTP